MALFRNLGVNLRDRLCDVPRYASAQSLDFLDLAKNCSFLNRKLTLVPSVMGSCFVDGHHLDLDITGIKDRAVCTGMEIRPWAARLLHGTSQAYPKTAGHGRL